MYCTLNPKSIPHTLSNEVIVVRPILGGNATSGLSTLIFYDVPAKPGRAAKEITSQISSQFIDVRTIERHVYIIKLVFVAQSGCKRAARK